MSNTAYKTKRQSLAVAAVLCFSVSTLAPILAKAESIAYTTGERAGNMIQFDPVGGFVGINPHINAMWLVDANSDALIAQITDGTVFDRALLPPNLSVMVQANADTESVQFGYGGAIATHTENVAPYALAGDNGGDYHSFPLPDGWHTVRARPFAADNAIGTYGDEVLISFAIFEYEIVVNTTLDGHDSAPGDGVCSANLSGGIDDFQTRTASKNDNHKKLAGSSNLAYQHDGNEEQVTQQTMAVLAGSCTLRAAIEESNARAGTQRIQVPNLGSNYDIPLGTLIITAPVYLEGLNMPIVDAGDDHRLMRIDGADGVVIDNLSLRNGDVRSCCKKGNGGNLRIADSTVEIVDSQIRDGLATNGGGIAVVDSSLTITRSRISGNHAGDPGHTSGGISGVNQWGGGLHILFSDVTINSTSIYQNGAVRGAGMMIGGDSEVFIKNTAIIENEAFQQGAGIATTIAAGGDTPNVYITWSTIARNAGLLAAPEGWDQFWTGGGLWINYGDVIIGNSIVAENTIKQFETMASYGPDCYVGANGSFTSYRGNIIGEISDACPLTDPHVAGQLPWDTFGTTGNPYDAGLGNTTVGSRPTIELLQSSLAVDHGSNNEALEFFGPCPPEDVRGAPRPADASVCDVGATERQ